MIKNYKLQTNEDWSLNNKWKKNVYKEQTGRAAVFLEFQMEQHQQNGLPLYFSMSNVPSTSSNS